MEKPSIVSLAAEGVADTVRAACQMPILLALVWLAHFATSAFIATLTSTLPLDSPRLPVLVVTGLALWSIVASCIVVTLQRFVVLSEVNSAASLLAHWRIVLPIGLVIFTMRLFSIAHAIAAHLFLSEGHAVGATLVGNLIILLTAIVFVAPRLLWLPAYAAADSDRSLITAARRGSGLILRTLAAGVVASIPVAPLGFLFALEPQTSLTLAGHATQSLCVIATTAAMAAVIARAFVWRTKQQSQRS